MNLADGDLLNRRPVWEAMSELFLDTELQENSLSHIASTLTQSPYSLDELESILFHEVYPVLVPNLLQTAGEWAGFDAAWLEAKIIERTRRRRIFKRMPQFSRWMIRDDWNRVKELVGE